MWTWKGVVYSMTPPPNSCSGGARQCARTSSHRYSLYVTDIHCIIIVASYLVWCVLLQAATGLVELSKIVSIQRAYSTYYFIKHPSPMCHNMWTCNTTSQVISEFVRSRYRVSWNIGRGEWSWACSIAYKSLWLRINMEEWLSIQTLSCNM